MGHIPHAENLWRPAYQADESEFPVPGMRANTRKMEKLLSRMGATQATRIILYDDQGNTDSARLWWILKLYGHRHVLILNGGLGLWKKSGYPVTLKIFNRLPVSEYHFESKSGEPGLLAELADVKKQRSDQGTIILDVRSKNEFNGKKRKSGAIRKGRIPNSVWLEHSLTHNQDGFLDKPQLEQLFFQKGITPNKGIITYCQSGVRSALTLFVLRELLGFPWVSNYDGSWIEWSHYSDLPLSTGDLDHINQF